MEGQCKGREKMEGRGEKGEEVRGREGKRWDRDFRASPSSKFATTPLVLINSVIQIVVSVSDPKNNFPHQTLMLRLKTLTSEADEPVGVVWSTANHADRLFERKARLEKQDTINNKLSARLQIPLLSLWYGKHTPINQKPTVKMTYN